MIIRPWLPVLGCMAIIFYASSLPATNIPGLFPFQDIVFHFAIYFILALFFARALKNTFSGIKPPRVIFITIIFVIFYGITDEFHQALVPNRCVSGFDVFIDGVGGFIGSLVYRWQR